MSITKNIFRLKKQYISIWNYFQKQLPELDRDVLINCSGSPFEITPNNEDFLSSIKEVYEIHHSDVLNGFTIAGRFIKHASLDIIFVPAGVEYYKISIQENKLYFPLNFFVMDDAKFAYISDILKALP